MARLGDPRLPARFWVKVDVRTAPDCWLWMGGLTPGGYGQYWVDGRNLRPHRVAYLALVRNVADGLQLDHLCRVRSCVNPAHLEVVTPQTNTLRGTSPAAINHAKTHCKAGHRLDGDNLVRHALRKGYRACRTCQLRYSRESKARGRRGMASA